MVPDDPPRDGADVLTPHPAPRRSPHPPWRRARRGLRALLPLDLPRGAGVRRALHRGLGSVPPLRSRPLTAVRRPRSCRRDHRAAARDPRDLACARVVPRAAAPTAGCSSRSSLVAALLLSVASPLRNELWWSSCAILMALALSSRCGARWRSASWRCSRTYRPPRDRSIHETTPVGILGLWIGMPFWVATAAVDSGPHGRAHPAAELERGARAPAAPPGPSLGHRRPRAAPPMPARSADGGQPSPDRLPQPPRPRRLAAAPSSSPRASCRSSPSSPMGCATARSPSACRYHARQVHRHVATAITAARRQDRQRARRPRGGRRPARPAGDAAQVTEYWYSVKPIALQIAATIQKRRMIFVSDHAMSSKWWWIGAMRKTRLRKV